MHAGPDRLDKNRGQREHMSPNPKEGTILNKMSFKCAHGRGTRIKPRKTKRLSEVNAVQPRAQNRRKGQRNLTVKVKCFEAGIGRPESPYAAKLVMYADGVGGGAKPNPNDY